MLYKIYNANKVLILESCCVVVLILINRYAYNKIYTVVTPGQGCDLIFHTLLG